jgi:hypothetical protein
MSYIVIGVMNMPYHLAMSSELSRIQFYNIATAYFRKTEKISKELEVIVNENRALRNDADKFGIIQQAMDNLKDYKRDGTIWSLASTLYPEDKK